MYDLQELLQPQIHALISNTQIIQKKALTKLNTDYANELQPDHTPRFWDPYKERHRQKVKMAHELQTSLKKQFNLIHEIERFIFLYENQIKQNYNIDQKGGRYAAILQSNIQELENIHAKILQMHHLIETENFWKIKIIRHLLALEKEACLEKKVQIKSIDLELLKSCHDYHRKQINIAESNLINLYTDVFNELKTPIERKIVKKEVEDFRLSLIAKLDDQQQHISLANLKANTDEKLVSEQVHTAKLQLMKNEIDKLKRQELGEQIFQANININKLDELTTIKKIKIFLSAYLIDDFCENLQIDEKNMFWGFLIAHKGNVNTYLEGTERKKRKECWYKGCYTGMLDEEYSGLNKAEINDPLKLDFLNRQLKSLDFDSWSRDELIAEIDNLLNEYIANHVNEAKVSQNERDNHKILVFRDWAIKIKKRMEQFKSNISEAFSLAESIEDTNRHASDHSQLSGLVNLIYAKLIEVNNNNNNNNAANTDPNTANMHRMFNTGTGEKFKAEEHHEKHRVCFWF